LPGSIRRPRTADADLHGERHAHPTTTVVVQPGRSHDGIQTVTPAHSSRRGEAGGWDSPKAATVNKVDDYRALERECITSS
jgi:hypothetical protein